MVSKQSLTRTSESTIGLRIFRAARLGNVKWRIAYYDENIQIHNYVNP